MLRAACSTARRMLFAALVLATGCTLVNLSRGPTQCGSDRDCTELGLRGALCSADGFCTGFEASTGDSGSASCRSNADCAQSSAVSGRGRCVQSQCVPLLSEDCFDAYGAVARDDAMYVGALVAQSGTTSAVSIDAQTAVAMGQAVNDFNGSLREGSGRPLVLVLCDETRDARRAVRHLTGTVSTRAIVGPSLRESVGDLLAEAGDRTLFISPNLDRQSELTQGGGRVWSLALVRDGAAAQLASAIAAMRTEIVQREPAFASNPVLVVSQDRAASELAANAAVLPTSWRRIETPDVFSSAAPVDYAEIVQRLSTPSVERWVFGLAGGLRDFGRIVDQIENARISNWPGGRPKPYYLAWERSELVETAAALGLTTAAPDGGADPGSLPPWRRILTFAAWRSAQVTQFRDLIASRVQRTFSRPIQEGVERAYDATLLAALALNASAAATAKSVEDVAPEDFQQALVRFSSKSNAPRLIRIDDVSALLDAARGPAPFDVYGASGELDFEGESRAPVGDATLYCIERNDERPKRVAYAPSGLRFAPKTGEAQGEFQCVGW